MDEGILHQSNFTISSFTNKIVSYADSFSLDSSSKKFLKLRQRSPYCDENSHFICKKCKVVPELDFISLGNANYSCTCNTINNMPIDEIIKNNIIVEEDEEDYNNNNKKGELKYNNFENYLKCNEHKKNFVYYCQTCEQNLCRDCLRSTDYHHNHILLLFDLKYYEIVKMKNHIEEIFINEKNQQIDDILDNEKNQQISRLMSLFSTIFNDFISHPNYSHITIISNMNTFLDKFIANKNNNTDIETLHLQKQIKINSKKLRFENITNSEDIIEINIYKSNLNDLTDLCKLNLINLKKLKLTDNCITNIKPILNANFNDLEILNFAQNKLGNDNIKYLCNLNLQKLTELNLYSNNITDSKIFNLKNNRKCLPSLENFYIGCNFIEWNLNNDLDNRDNIKYDFSSLKKIGLTTGIFDNQTITFMYCFKFHNLEFLYMARNNFSSLSFLDKLDLPSLKYFSVHTSNIIDFYPLNKFKTLEQIYMKGCCISKINKLKEFVEKLPNLKILDLSENLIDMNHKDNIEIINYFFKKEENKLKNFDLYI